MNRLLLNKIILLLSTLSAVVGIAFLFWILATLTYKGVSSLHFSTFTNDLVEGGIRNLLVGQFTMALIASAIAIPIGMFAGIWLREYSNNSKLASVIRNLSDIMMSAPSIVIGVFVLHFLWLPLEATTVFQGLLL